VNLGRTGLRVSRICLGMMSYGRSDERPWFVGWARMSSMEGSEKHRGGWGCRCGSVVLVDCAQILGRGV
jgi:hypothetical protein